jgi:hypothetical protein
MSWDIDMISNLVKKATLRTLHSPNRFLLLLSPWLVLSAVLLKFLLFRFMKQLKTSSRGLEWLFQKKSSRALKVTDFEITAFLPTSALKLILKIDTN